MSTTINESNYPNYSTPGNSGTSGGDKVSKYMQKLFSRNGISGNIELGQDSDGRISVLNDHPQKSEIENLLNNDAKLSSMLSGNKPSTPGGQNTASDKKGMYHENADGDYVFISDVAMQAMERRRSNHLGSIDRGSMKTLEEFMESAFTQEEKDAWTEIIRQADININYKRFGVENPKYTSGFKTSKTGAMWFDHAAGLNMPIRRGASSVVAGKSCISQERDVLNSSSESRKKVYAQLKTAMKQAGIELQQGQKVDFIMDEKGNVVVNPDSVKDKHIASKIQSLINDDKKLSGLFMDLLSKSSASLDADPASMRMHVDSVLREYTGKGFDDLEWDASGALIPPEGYEEAWEEFGGLSMMVGHLKYLQETEGDDIFKKEHSFSITATGIVDDKMKLRAGTNLFRHDKMWFDKSRYSEDTKSVYEFGFDSPTSEENIGDFWKMKALEDMIQAKGTTVYLSADPGNNFAEDANGNRQSLPYKSANYDATANYLIENYFIENGIEGNVSDYALKIHSKGSYEVIRIPSPDVSKLLQKHNAAI